MLDLKDIRLNPDKYRDGMSRRGKDPAEIDALLTMDAASRAFKTLQQERQSLLNKHTAEYGKLKRKGITPLEQYEFDFQLNDLDIRYLIAGNELHTAYLGGKLAEFLPTIMEEFRTGEYKADLFAEDKARWAKEDSEVITVITGQPRSGTSLTMQMLVAAGYNVFWNREPNNGGYELRDGIWKQEDPKKTWALAQGKYLKTFPHNFQYLHPEKFKYRFIYLDRDPCDVAYSGEMCEIESAFWKSRGVDERGMRQAVKEQREWSLWVLQEYYHVVLKFDDLFTGKAQDQLGKFLFSTSEQIAAMKAVSCTPLKINN